MSLCSKSQWVLFRWIDLSYGTPLKFYGQRLCQLKSTRTAAIAGLKYSSLWSGRLIYIIIYIWTDEELNFVCVQCIKWYHKWIGRPSSCNQNPWRDWEGVGGQKCICVINVWRAIMDVLINVYLHSMILLYDVWVFLFCFG